MVNPIYIFIIALVVGILLSLIDKLGRNTAMLIFFAALAGMTFISGQWFFSIFGVGTFSPPASVLCLTRNRPVFASIHAFYP